MLVTILCGGIMGMAMNKCGVVIPSEITKQFSFRSWIMLKMFMGAVVMSCTSTIIEFCFRPEFEATFREKVRCRKRGYPSVLLGSFLLGVGMLVAGSCPGTVFAQMGSGISSSFPTFAGGMVGGLAFGLLEGHIASFLAYGNNWGKHSTLDEMLGVKFVTGAMLFVAMCVTVVVILELFAYPSSAVITFSPTGSNPLSDNIFTAVSWHPVIGGLVLGSLQAVLMHVNNRMLGTSSSYVTLGGTMFLPVLKAVNVKSKYLEAASSDKNNWYQVLFVTSMIAGAALSATLSNTMGVFHGPGTVQAFFGSFMLVFGSRMADGCTSGHGISGFALLSLNSILAVVGMFGGAIIVGEITLAAGLDFAAY
jgi:uncharacterized membrane protein YedE/YeeE